MQITEILTEMASGKLYHITSVYNALTILRNQEFRLSVAIGTKSERDINHGYPYYLSTSRNKLNDYTKYIANQSVMFNLKGNFFNRHHKVKPVDYYGRDMWMATHGGHSADIRTSEQEDRILSTEPSISFKENIHNAIDSIHVLLKDRKNTNDKSGASKVRKLLILAKQLDIPAYLYKDEEHFRLQHPTKNVKPDIKDKAEPFKPYFRTYANRYIKPWVEIYFKNNINDLSEYGKKLVHNITTSWSSPTEDFGLSNDIHNSKVPSSDGRKYIESIISIMRKEDFSSIVDYAQAMRTKWRKIQGYDE